MVKFYKFTLIAITICLLQFLSFGQVQTDQSMLRVKIQDSLNQLHVYPNPVSQGKLYISSPLNNTKTIEIFDVLGKKILETSLLGTILDISELNRGVYILKIKEGSVTSTRKLVVR